MPLIPIGFVGISGVCPGQRHRPKSSRTKTNVGAATFRTISEVRMYDAVRNETPTPVASATYAATQAGHSHKGIYQTGNPRNETMRRVSPAFA